MARRHVIVALLVILVAGRALTAQRGGAQGAAATPATPDVPIVGLAGVAFRVSDLAKSRAYYQGVLGLPEAFSTKDQSGRIASVYFKINDDQYVELVPDMKPGELRRQARVTFQSSDLKKLHAIYTERGLNPTAITTGPDGNLVFRVLGPSGAKLDFLEYVPGSQQGQLRG